MEKKKALITGANGFVGKYLIEKLLNENFEVYGTALDGDLYEDDRITMEHLDLTDALETQRIVEKVKPDVVYHLASQSSVKLSWDKPQLTFNVNVIGTINLLEAIRCFIPKSKILLVGSSEEYGSIFKNESNPKEESKCIPENIYAITKSTQNYLGNMYYKAYGMDIVMTRSFNHVGPGQSPQFVISDFCKQVAEIELNNHGPIINVGNLASCRDFLDVQDVVNAYYELSMSGIAGQTYNVGSGNSYKIEDLLNIIINMSEIDIKINIDKNKFRPIEIQETCADISKITKDTNWFPKYPIEETILNTLNYWREKYQNKIKKYELY